jgi:diadenosine tetraphosphate (Ap4A) HIT family hydrolase
VPVSSSTHPRCVHCQTTIIIRTIIPHPLEPIFLCAAGNCQPSSTPKPTSCSLALADILHPQAKLQLHALIVPKRHIVSVLDLTPSDLPLLHSLQDLGNQLLVWFGIPNNARTHARARMVFHVPPFHSVSHLHLHVHSSDEGLTWTGRIKYWTETKWCCSTSWESVVKRLEVRRRSVANQTTPIPGERPHTDSDEIHLNQQGGRAK